MANLIAEIKTEDGKLLATLIMPARIFKTGSKGHFGTAKSPALKEGERFQISVQAVIIGSKPQ
jgi:hypothetical protein